MTFAPVLSPKVCLLYIDPVTPEKYTFQAYSTICASAGIIFLDFDNIIVKDREKDLEVYGLPTMHEVRKKVTKISKPYQEVLSVDVINKYINYDFWNQQ